MDSYVKFSSNQSYSFLVRRMSSLQLDNLVKAGMLKAEPADQREFDGLLNSGRRRLADARRAGLSPESQFDLAYNAAHALSLAAMRWHGYRPNKVRFVVFQALPHTLKLKPELWRVLDKCHRHRNSVEYEGYLISTSSCSSTCSRQLKLSERLLKSSGQFRNELRTHAWTARQYAPAALGAFLTATRPPRACAPRISTK